MRGAGRAITWALWRRHRVGFGAIGTFVLAVGATRAFVGARASGSEMDAGVAFSSVVPLTCAVLYVLVVFTHGLDGDLAGRDSLFPRRLFTLPVSTRALVTWPLSSGAAAMALLWMASASLVLRPSGFAVPLAWPAVLLVAFLAWMAVILWTPMRLGGVRMALAVLLVIGVDSAGVLAMTMHPSESLMLGILLPQLPAAFLLAEAAVARARSQGGAEVHAGATERARVVVPDDTRAFPSAPRALGWLEWGQFGRSLPVWVAIVAPLELALLFIPGTDTGTVLVAVLVGVLVTPPVLAAFIAPSVRRIGAERDRGGMSSFVATRPVPTATLVAAKMSATVRSTMAAWIIVAVLTPLALTLSGTWPLASEAYRALARAIGGARAVAFCVMICAWFALATWRRLVQGLHLAGRGWLTRASTAAAIGLLIALVPLARWVVARPAVEGALWSGIPLVLAAVACAKVAMACVIAVRLDATRALSERALLLSASTWLAGVGAVYGTLAWLVDSPHVPRYVLLLTAVVVIPVARLGAAPLAIVRARHG